MKAIIEKEQAETIQFDNSKDYIVLRNFNHHEPLGVAKVDFNNGILYADFLLKENIKGYPAVGLIRGIDSNLYNLECIGICDNPNLDETIGQIEYICKSEGKPSNLKTK